MKSLHAVAFLIISAAAAAAQTNTYPWPASGNVGIGTTAPGALLTLSRNADIALRLDTTSAVSAARNWAIGNSRLAYGDLAVMQSTELGGDPLAAGTARMYFGNTGNVGIGTTAPTRKLSVIGGVMNVGGEGDYYGAWLAGSQSEDSYLGLGEWWNRAGYVRWMKAERRLAIYTTSASEPLTLQETTGNVGIGTRNPTEKLSVNGKIRAKEVIVETAGWSDHVFAKDYKLASLSEVEQHVQQQGHLPGVPSAAEVAEKGVSVGDMQAVLLAKIEELTLHLIAQEKELIALRTEVKQMRHAK